MLMKDIIDMLDARVIYIADENIYEKNHIPLNNNLSSLELI